MKTGFSRRWAKDESARCLLCHDAPCTKACPQSQDPARFLRALRFDNEAGAWLHLPECGCGGDAPCEKVCIHPDFPIRIASLCAFGAENLSKISANHSDLSIEFCGVTCENPFFLSSSIVASNFEMCKRALTMGWAGVVFKTIGVMTPREVSPRFDSIGKEGTPFIGFKNLEQIAEHPLEDNLRWMREIKEAFPHKVLVASIMGQTEEEWTYLAKAVTEVGADIIECNFSCPHMSGEGLGSDVGQNPDLVKSYTQAVKRGTHLPVLAKMTPNLGQMEPPAIAAIKGGANGLAAINTIKCITGVDRDTLSSMPSVSGKSAVSGYSGKTVKPIALRFISDLAGHMRLKSVPISGMGGIETWQDALEFLLLGCSNIQITTAVMQYGYRIIDDLIEGLSSYMAQKGITSVRDLVGASLSSIVPAGDLDRETVAFPRFHRDACVGCGRCHISCADAGHQAIAWDSDSRIPKLMGLKCVGCHLCIHACPIGAISAGNRNRKSS